LEMILVFFEGIAKLTEPKRKRITRIITKACINNYSSISLIIEGPFIINPV